MNIKQVRALAVLMERAGLSLLEITEADQKIRMEKALPTYVSPAPAQQSAVRPAALSESAPLNGVSQKTGGAVDFSSILEVRSPMVGIFYAAPSPDAAPFVERGSKVKKGDVLCIVEAMKLMNEIVAETDGEIVDICAENGQVVEYAQVLFKVF